MFGLSANLSGNGGGSSEDSVSLVLSRSDEFDRLLMLPELRNDSWAGENWLLDGRLCLSGLRGRLGVICSVNSMGCSSELRLLLPPSLL